MIRNPAFPGDPVYDMAFNLYAMEEEGLLPTHKGCLNAFCDFIIKYGIDPDDRYDLQRAYDECGVDWLLDAEDRAYIYGRTGIMISL